MFALIERSEFEGLLPCNIRGTNGKHHLICREYCVVNQG